MAGSMKTVKIWKIFANAFTVMTIIFNEIRLKLS